MTGRELVVRDPDRARAAHLLRRTTLDIDPDRITALADLSWDDAVTSLIDGAQSGGQAGGEVATTPSSDDWSEVAGWWVGRMVDGGSGLVDRMAWFWHGLLTTSAEKVSSAALVADQVAILRANALGDYRTLLRSVVTSGAMLEYLDASWSIAANPNENLARELMELFTVGRDAYDEDDVRAAARALAGWVVEDDEVTWRRENAFVAPLLFRGIQDDWDTDRVIDHLCDAPETAVRISSRLWKQLVGTVLDPDQAVELGRWWQDRDLSIIALVERILRDPAAEAGRLNRVRTGLEWFVAFRSVTNAPDDGAWGLDGLGQMPYRPPNVAGWPDGSRWLSASSLLARASFAFNFDADRLGSGRSGTTADILDRCGLHEVGPATIEALDGVRSGDDLSPEGAYHLRWRLALSSPEFHLS